MLSFSESCVPCTPIHSEVFVSRTLMSGNEAVARGAWEAGALRGVGYPGTPSTEVLENLTRYDNVRCEWAPNEKVAAEVLPACAWRGRSIVT